MPASRKAPWVANKAIPQRGFSFPSVLPFPKHTRDLEDSPSITGSARIFMPPRRVKRRGRDVGSMLEAAQEAEGGGYEAAGRGGRLVLLLPPSASIIPADISRPTALPLPMVPLRMADNDQTVPCVVGVRVVRCVRSEKSTRGARNKFWPLPKRHTGISTSHSHQPPCKPI